MIVGAALCAWVGAAAPGELVPAAPEPAAPEATTPELTTPEATTPEPVAPEAVAPEAVAPDPDAPETVPPASAPTQATTPSTEAQPRADRDPDALVDPWQPPPGPLRPPNARLSGVVRYADLRDPFAVRRTAEPLHARAVAVVHLDLEDPFAARRQPAPRVRPAGPGPVRRLDLQDPFEHGVQWTPCRARRSAHGVPVQRPAGMTEPGSDCATPTGPLLDPFADPLGDPPVDAGANSGTRPLVHTPAPPA